MLKQNNRIKGKKNVEFILKKGDSSKTALFFIKKLPNNLEHPRFAIVISGKVEKSAVKRNKKRRQIYEIIRQKLEEKLPISESSDIVLLAKHPLMNTSFEELKNHLREILTREL